MLLSGTVIATEKKEVPVLVSTYEATSFVLTIASSALPNI
jgi:hypothetical protein